MCVCCNYHGFFVNGRNVARICYLFLVNHSVFIVIIISSIFAGIVCGWRHHLFLHVSCKILCSYICRLCNILSSIYFIFPWNFKNFYLAAVIYAIYEWLCDLVAGFCSTAKDASSCQKEIFFIGWFFLFHLVMVAYLVLQWIEWS